MIVASTTRVSVFWSLSSNLLSHLTLQSDFRLSPCGKSVDSYGSYECCTRQQTGLHHFRCIHQATCQGYYVIALCGHQSSIVFTSLHRTVWCSFTGIVSALPVSASRMQHRHIMFLHLSCQLSLTGRRSTARGISLARSIPDLVQCTQQLFH